MWVSRVCLFQSKWTVHGKIKLRNGPDFVKSLAKQEFEKCPIWQRDTKVNAWLYQLRQKHPAFPGKRLKIFPERKRPWMTGFYSSYDTSMRLNGKGRFQTELIQCSLRPERGTIYSGSLQPVRSRQKPQRLLPCSLFPHTFFFFFFALIEIEGGTLFDHNEWLV